jgi:aspartate 1-decarboxylase
MYRTLLLAKIHRATVTGADISYEGSITIDSALLAAAGIFAYERVQVVDVANGQRLETYVMAGESGSGVIQLNGAAARLVAVGDKVIIMAYGLQAEPVAADYSPTLVFVDGANRIVEVRRAGAGSDPGATEG